MEKPCINKVILSYLISAIKGKVLWWNTFVTCKGNGTEYSTAEKESGDNLKIEELHKLLKWCVGHCEQNWSLKFCTLLLMKLRGLYEFRGLILVAHKLTPACKSCL